MDKVNEARYVQILERSVRYDGKFYFAVRTTNIFCRPSCPAPRPLEKNVVFYDDPDEALRDGFRACKRCHPEQLFENRKLEVINGINTADATSMKDVAGSLGMSDRQLRRITAQSLGMSPLHITQARRLAIAKNLLLQTKMKIIDIAFSANFESLRQFNDIFKKYTGSTPSAFRHMHSEDMVQEVLPESIELQLRLHYQKPFLWEPLKRALLAHMIPGLENINTEHETLERMVRTEHGHAKLTLSLKKPIDTIDAAVNVIAMEDIDEVISVIKRIFDLDCNPAAISEKFIDDPLLGSLVKARPGLRICGMFDPFELLINTIIGQQISIAAARTLSTRLVHAYGQRIDNLYVFPTPKTIIEADPLEIYEKTKLNHKKIATIRAVSQLIVGGLDLSNIANHKATKEKLLSVKGIGPWTVEYLALRGFGDPDGFPADDLIVKRALGVGTSKAAEKMAEAWRPYRGYATMHIWTKGTYA
jgi:AraC family transcriptional regulator of adaptative response / DNA-3-methyladenine glycosylase II